MEIDERLQPIAQRPVDVTRPGWLDRLRAGAPPLEEAGVRERSEGLLSELIVAYAQSTEEMRAAIRRLFRDYRSFAWAAALSAPRTTAQSVRQHLILFSMKDHGRDSRDALLTLGEICRDGRAAGLEMAPILREVAAMSSDENRFGMGSTRQMLLRHAQAA